MNASQDNQQRPLWFGLAYGLAAAVIAGVLALLVSDRGLVNTDQHQALIATLMVNMIIIVVLAGIIAISIWRLWQRKRAGDAPARLHLKYVALFSLAAATPAVIIALMFGVSVTRGLDAWFSPHVKSLVQNSVDVARSYVREETDSLKAEVLALATDLNRVSNTLATNPTSYREYLKGQATFRNLPAIYVLNAEGQQLAAATSPKAPDLLIPQPLTFDAAAAGDLILSTDDSNDTMRALYRLEGYDGAYLYVIRFVDAGILSRLRSAEASAVSYRNAENERNVLELIFILAYIQVALLVLVGAAWLGRVSATRITGPVGRLVLAAQQVAKGDLSQRIDTGQEPSELQLLSATFNHMTTELAEQQTALRDAALEAEDRRVYIETILSGVSAGVISLDKDQLIKGMNDSALKLLHLTPQKVIGQPLRDVLPQFSPQDGSQDVPTEIILNIKGEDRHIVAKQSELDTGYVLTFDDVTNLMTAQRHAAWRDVARRVAHEIKNPLTPIQLSVERLQRKYRPMITSDLDAFDRCAEIILRQVNDIGLMIDEFSTFARMPKPIKTIQDIQPIVRDAIDSAREGFPRITYDFVDADQTLLCDCDERMVMQALVNILKNGSESVMEHGGSNGYVRTILDTHNDNIRIKIVDNGKGLPSKDRHRLTEPYVTNREKGTGLGLAIVRRTLNEHDGDLILADNENGQGASIAILLPIAQPDSTVKQKNSIQDKNPITGKKDTQYAN